MRYLLLFMILFNLSALGQPFSFGDSAVFGGVVASMAACATTNTTLPHDTLLEGFQTATTGFENSAKWTVVNTNTTTINAAYDSSALITGKPDGACSQAFQCVVGGDQGYALYDHGSNVLALGTLLDIYFYIYVSTAPDAGESYYIAEFGNAAAPNNNNVAVQLINNSGTIQLKAISSADSAAQTISTGQWVKVKLHMDRNTTSNSTMTIDAGVPAGFTCAGVTVRYGRLGVPTGAAAGDSGTFAIDLLTWEIP